MSGVKFLFFAQCVDWMNLRELHVVLDRPQTIEKILQSEPRLHPVRVRQDYLRVAVNRECVSYRKEVRNGDEVAFLPPFSGG